MFFSLCEHYISYFHLIFFTNIFNGIFIFLWLFILYQFFLIKSFSYKLIFFFFNLIALSIWNFYMNLGEFFLLILQAELIIFYLIILLWTQTKKNYFLEHNFLQNTKLWIHYFTIIILVFFFYYNVCFININVINVLNFNYYLKTNHIVSTDFFFLFYFFFYQFNYITICIGLIISLISCFFILLFKNLSFLKNIKMKKYSYYYFLRKQNLIHQALYSSLLKFFKKNI